MNYEIINDAINDIIRLVNCYNQRHNYSVELCEELVVSLLGYYLVFGPSLFKKINELLEQLHIHRYESGNDYFKIMGEINSQVEKSYVSPVMVCEYIYGNGKMVKGVIPHILIPYSDSFMEIDNMVHELSHALQLTESKVLREDEKEFVYQQGFSRVTMVKENNSTLIENGAFSEFITVCIENRIINALFSLDGDKVNNKFVKRILGEFKKLNGHNVLTDSYSTFQAVGKDLMDNDIFFSLIKKYYYENECEIFEEEFDSYSEEVKLKNIMRLIRKIDNDNFYNIMLAIETIKKKIDLFNKATNFVPDSSLILVI